MSKKKKILTIILSVVALLLLVAIIAMGVTLYNSKVAKGKDDEKVTLDEVEATYAESSEIVTEAATELVTEPVTEPAPTLVSDDYEKYNESKPSTMTDYMEKDDVKRYYDKLGGGKNLPDTWSEADDKFELLITDDRTQVFKHTLVKMSPKDLENYLDTLNKYLDSVKVEKLERLKEIKNNSEIKDPRIIERYYDYNNSLVCEREYVYSQLIGKS